MPHQGCQIVTPDKFLIQENIVSYGIVGEISKSVTRNRINLCRFNQVEVDGIFLTVFLNQFLQILFILNDAVIIVINILNRLKTESQVYLNKVIVQEGNAGSDIIVITVGHAIDIADNVGGNGEVG